MSAQKRRAYSVSKTIARNLGGILGSLLRARGAWTVTVTWVMVG